MGRIQMNEDKPVTDAARLANMLRDLVDAMIPGDGGWPSASFVGVQGVLGMRLLETVGENCLDQLDRAVLDCGGPLSELDAEARLALLARLEKERPQLFALVTTATYLAYYESPAVVRQVQSLGQPYKAIPALGGYPSTPFDLEHDRPNHGRGSYLATDQVRPVDLSSLQHVGGVNG